MVPFVLLLLVYTHVDTLNQYTLPWSCLVHGLISIFRTFLFAKTDKISSMFIFSLLLFCSVLGGLLTLTEPEEVRTVLSVMCVLTAVILVWLL